MAVPERITWAIDQLAVKPTDRLLEIGCGRGVAVEQICQRMDGGHVLAIDRSVTAIEAATKRNARFVEAGTAMFETNPVDEAELGAARFDKVFAINVNLFWTHTPNSELAAIKRALTPSGSVYLFYEPPSASRASEIAEWLVPHLAAAGYAPRVVTGETTKGASLLALIAHPVT